MLIIIMMRANNIELFKYLYTKDLIMRDKTESCTLQRRMYGLDNIKSDKSIVINVLAQFLVYSVRSCHQI